MPYLPFFVALLPGAVFCAAILPRAFSHFLVSSSRRGWVAAPCFAVRRTAPRQHPLPVACCRYHSGSAHRSPAALLPLPNFTTTLPFPPRCTGWFTARTLHAMHALVLPTRHACLGYRYDAPVDFRALFLCCATCRLRAAGSAAVLCCSFWFTSADYRFLTCTPHMVSHTTPHWFFCVLHACLYHCGSFITTGLGWFFTAWIATFSHLCARHCHCCAYAAFCCQHTVHDAVGSLLLPLPSAVLSRASARTHAILRYRCYHLLVPVRCCCAPAHWFCMRARGSPMMRGSYNCLTSHIVHARATTNFYLFCTRLRIPLVHHGFLSGYATAHARNIHRAACCLLFLHGFLHCLLLLVSSRHPFSCCARLLEQRFLSPYALCTPAATTYHHLHHNAAFCLPARTPGSGTAPTMVLLHCVTCYCWLDMRFAVLYFRLRIVVTHFCFRRCVLRICCCALPFAFPAVLTPSVYTPALSAPLAQHAFTFLTTSATCHALSR